MWKLIASLLKRIFGLNGGDRVPRNSQPLSNLDAVLLGLDEPTNMMMITGVMIFEGDLEGWREAAPQRPEDGPFTKGSSNVG